jgi:hypothetical protein
VRRGLIACAILFLLVAPANAQSKRGVAFVSPPAGATVAGPKVYVHVAFENLKPVAAGGIVRPGEGHAHILIDRDPVAHGQSLPTDQPNVVHLGKPPLTERSIDVGLGEHRLVAQLGNSAHKAMGASTAEVTINVVAGFRGRGALTPACAEVASGTGEVRLVFPSAGGHLQGSITSTCTFATDAGACGWQSVSDRRIYGSFDPGGRTLDGTTGGSTTRQLVSGTGSRCGNGGVDRLDQIPFRAAFADGIVSGTFGQAHFTVRSDPSVVLENAVAASTTTPEPSKRSLIPSAIAAGLIAVLGAGGAYALARRRRRSARVAAPEEVARVTVPPIAEPTPVAQPSPTAGPPTQADAPAAFCPECGSERRPGLAFCTHCGHHF